MKDHHWAYVVLVLMIMLFIGLAYSSEKDKRDRTAKRNATCSVMCPTDKAACYQYFMEESELKITTTSCWVAYGAGTQ